MKRKIASIFIIFISIIFLSSCQLTVIENKPKEQLKIFFDSIVDENYEKAYEVYHPLLKEKIPFTDFVNNISKSEEKDGKIVSIKIDKLITYDIKKKEYNYEVTVVTQKKVSKLFLNMIKENNIWYLNAIIGKGAKEIK